MTHRSANWDSNPPVPYAELVREGMVSSPVSAPLSAKRKADKRQRYSLRASIGGLFSIGRRPPKVSPDEQVHDWRPA